MLFLAVEDDLSEHVMRKLVFATHARRQITCLKKKDKSYLKSRIAQLNSSGGPCPFLVLADSDHDGCAVDQKKLWLPKGESNNLSLRFAVREVEAWLLADAESFAHFFGVDIGWLPNNPDNLDDPKRTLIQLAGASKRKFIRDAVVPKAGARVGQGYTELVGSFVREHWNPDKALGRSDSLARTIRAIQSL